jgi:hypothetical protein
MACVIINGRRCDATIPVVDEACSAAMESLRSSAFTRGDLGRLERMEQSARNLRLDFSLAAVARH